jgi:hypothetical protein
MKVLTRAVALALACGAVGGASIAGAAQFSGWGSATLVDPQDSSGVNTPAQDGCPIQSPDGHSLYIASNRAGGAGALDLWVATRDDAGDPWGEPVNLSELNTSADEFCPTPVRGGGLFFVRRPSACGLGDIYFARRNPKHGWSEPERLACAPSGPNSELDEMGPAYFEADGAAQLYFSRSRAAAQGGAVPGDIFSSTRGQDGAFGAAAVVGELSAATANDIQPNVRKDGREIVFSSNRAGGAGSQDVWVATREDAGDPWSAPVNLQNTGAPVNTSESETRPSLSWRGETLYFGRAPAAGGPGDVYAATRQTNAR